MVPALASGFLSPGAQDSWNLRAFPCSATKKPVPDDKKVAAQELYQGLYFTKALAAARAIPSSRVLILSGLHGFIEPSTPIATYNKRLDPRFVDHTRHCDDQVSAMGLPTRHAPEVIASHSPAGTTPTWPHWPHLTRPLASAAIGIQLQRLTRIAESADPRATALAFAAEAAIR